MKSGVRLIPALILLLVMSQLAWAHPGHDTGGGFGAGLNHPFSGIDHILAMMAVGLWAVQVGGRALWMLPVTFLAFMIGGGWLSMMGVPMPLVEQGIMASVLILGLMIAVAVKIPMGAQVTLVGTFALFHGYAHVTEMNAAHSAADYAAGFILATALLHGCGLALGFAGKRLSSWKLLRMAGGAIAVCGLGLFLHLI